MSPRLIERSLVSTLVTDSALEKWPPYHWLETPRIESIVKDYWNPKFDDHDMVMYNRFLDILRLSKNGLNGDEIGRILHVNNVRKYLTCDRMSFLTNLRARLDKLGPPKEDRSWLPLNLRPRGTPGDDWIQVPKSPLKYECVADFIYGVREAETDPALLREFGFISPFELQQEKVNLFAFLLGAIVGDFGKDLRGTTRFPSMRLSLVLSTNKPNSFRFGTFAALCANVSLDLKMRRMKNLPISKSRFGKTECFAWISPTSPLVAWIFHDCLGLKVGETTTHDPVRMDWLLNTPRDFRVHFIQGLAESDGWPDAGDDVTKVVSSPNTKLFRQLFDHLGCHVQTANQPPVQLLRCGTEEAAKLPFFNPRIHSNLYKDMQTLANAKRYPERLRLPQETINMIRELSRSSSSANEVCLNLARKTGSKVSADTVRKYTRI